MITIIAIVVGYLLYRMFKYDKNRVLYAIAGGIAALFLIPLIFAQASLDKGTPAPTFGV